MTESERQPAAPSATPSAPVRRRWRRVMRVFVILLVIYLALAYIILPALWEHYEHHPKLATAPKTTQTGLGMPGDPLNVALVGTKQEVIKALLLAGWYPADPLTFRSSAEIVERVLLNRPYKDAPVSNLFLFGRKQDLAFERPTTKSPRKREHVRLWESQDHGVDGRPLWLGAVTYDDGVGVSHYTGQVTHHIDPDIDAERDQLMHDLTAAGQLERTYQVTGVGLTFNGRNGGGDWYYTDGEMDVGVVSPHNAREAKAPEELANPAPVAMKNTVWSWLHPWLPSQREVDDRAPAANPPADTAPDSARPAP